MAELPLLTGSAPKLPDDEWNLYDGVVRGSAIHIHEILVMDLSSAISVTQLKILTISYVQHCHFSMYD